MPLSPDFSDYVEELIAGFGKVDIRKMFGGALVSRGGVGFAVLDDDTCFIKADAGMGAELKKQGSKPWKYSVKPDGTVREIAYWSLPASAADDADEATALVKRSFEIAKKAAAAKAQKPVRKTPAKKKTAKAAAKKAPAKKSAKKAAPKREK